MRPRAAASCSCSRARCSRALGSGGSRESASRRRSSSRSQLAAALAPVGGATNECHGIQSCIRVPGPWVVVPAHGTTQYLLTCPGGKSVVGGLDAQVTSRDVRVDFVGRLGAPVQPGATTTRYALFRAVSTSPRAQLFQPLLGCVPTQGGGGRSTVSARTVSPPGQSLEFRSRIVVIGPGTVRFGRVACKPSERLVGAWHCDRVPDEAAARRSRTLGLRDGVHVIVGQEGRRHRAPPGTRCRSTCTRSSRSARSVRRELRLRRTSWSRSCSCRLLLGLALWFDRRRARYAVAFTNLDLLASVVAKRRRPWRRWIPLALFLLALAAASTALARPRANVSVTVEPARRSFSSSTSRARCAQPT